MRRYSSPEELGRELQAKFPQYEGRDAAELGRKYAAKRPDLVRIEATAAPELRPAAEMGYTDIDVGETISNLPLDLLDVTVETGKGLYDIAEQALRTPVSEGVLASLGRLGAGGIDVLAEKAGVEGVDLASPESEAAARQMGTEFTKSLSPENIEKRPAQALANALSVIPARGLLTGLSGAAKAAKAPRTAQALQTARKAVDYIDPTTTAYTATKKGAGAVKRRAEDFVGSVRQRGDRKLKEEYAEAALGFSTSVGEAAVRELRDLSNARGERWINRFRAWRGMPREEAFNKAFGEIRKATGEINKRASDSYDAAINKLSDVMSKPFRTAAVEGDALATLKQQVIDSITSNVEGAAIRDVRTVGYTPSGARGGEVVKYKVSFGDASGIDDKMRSVIASDIEEILNWNPNITGKQIHDWRRNLDQKISKMDSPTMPDGSPAPGQRAFGGRTRLRKTLADNIENAYGDRYKEAMRDYRRITEVKERLHNSFKITGTSLDKSKRETIIAELSNTYNPNARQGFRPDLLREFEELSGNEHIMAMTLGTLFQPFVSKGLAQRSELANIISMTGTALTGVATGDPVTTAVVFGLTQIPQQILYNPRMASEMIVRLSKGKEPGFRSKMAGAVDAMAKNYDKLPQPAKDFLKTLPPNTPMKVALERLANEAGYDITDISAAEGTQENKRLLRSLSRAGQTPPSR